MENSPLPNVFNNNNSVPNTQDVNARAPQSIDILLADVAQHVEMCPDDRAGKLRFMREISHEYAYVRLRDAPNPVRFLRQAAGKPPKRFGKTGFNPTLVDDQDPARHYTAFVFVGFWMPTSLAIITLWVWEILGFIRYRGTWSQPDIRMGYVGLRHGRQVRRIGPSVLPRLIEQDLREPAS